MNEPEKHLRRLILCGVLLAGALAAGCMADKDPILGGGAAALAPSVITPTPAINAVGVSTTAPGITVTFNQPMAALTGGASFTVTCVAPCVSPTGTGGA